MRCAECERVQRVRSPVIHGTAQEQLERICRYLLRGPLALGRLRQRPDGLLMYRLKGPMWKHVLVLAALQLLILLRNWFRRPQTTTGCTWRRHCRPTGFRAVV